VILADTSVWVQHIRSAASELGSLLVHRRLVMHPFVIGELACGNLPERTRFIAALNNLPRTTIADHAAVIDLVETRKLMGRGIGWVDAHLLASALADQYDLWTLDRSLARVAEDLSLPVKFKWPR
jgi:predicted nucleic acid-binding protein